MTTIDPKVFLNIFGLYVQKLPRQTAFFESEKIITDRVIRKGFVIDQRNGDQLILVDFEGQLFWGVKTSVHDLFPLQFLPIVCTDHLYSLFILYGKGEVLCN